MKFPAILSVLTCFACTSACTGSTEEQPTASRVRISGTVTGMDRGTITFAFDVEEPEANPNANWLVAASVPVTGSAFSQEIDTSAATFNAVSENGAGVACAWAHVFPTPQAAGAYVTEGPVSDIDFGVCKKLVQQEIVTGDDDDAAARQAKAAIEAMSIGSTFCMSAENDESRIVPCSGAAVKII